MYGDLRWDLDWTFDADESTGSSQARPEGIADSVVDAVTADLEGLAARAPHLALSSEAATALALAAEMDRWNSATSKSMCAKALNDTMNTLRELAPPAVEEDDLDDLKARRAKRLAGVSATSH